MNEISEIKNKITYARNVLSELEEELTEIELTDVLNTDKGDFDQFQNEMVLSGSTVNDMDGYDEYRECGTKCLLKVKVIGICSISLLLIVFLLCQ